MFAQSQPFLERAMSAVMSLIVARIAAFNRWRLPPLDAPHPLLTGIHAPMTEELTLDDLSVEGVIPPELDGTPYQAAGRLKPFDATVEIEPGVRSIATAGHTPGHTTYLFESEGHRLIAWGDILHVPAVQFAHPTVTMKFDVDPATAVKSRQAMFARVAADNDQVAGAHLFFPGIGRVRKNGAGYEWIPIAYPGQ